MEKIIDIQKKYAKKIDFLDLELILAHILKKPREFILTHPEFKIPTIYNQQLTTFIKRRIGRESLAYILGEKEFYGLKFKVNKNVLVPRPETELLVELALNELTTSNRQPTIIIDVGTGSGNIIISLAKELKKSKLRIADYQLLATDISNKALAVAKQNAKLHKVDKKIKFLQGDLLKPILKQLSVARLPASPALTRRGRQRGEPARQVSSQWSVMIIANLPYLSPKIYKNTPKSVKNYEPKKALLSQKGGLGYYDKLFQQVKKLSVARLPASPALTRRGRQRGEPARQVSCQLLVVIEFSPEQKPALQKLIKKHFPEAKIKFYKDLAKKWRVCNFEF